MGSLSIEERNTTPSNYPSYYYYFAVGHYLLWLNRINPTEKMRINDLILIKSSLQTNKQVLSLFLPDIDECSTNSHSCDVNVVCINNVGSYVCTSKAGCDGNTCAGELFA